jgi:threonine dehydrogenase-like Zn-dependent dehydrogenase
MFVTWRETLSNIRRAGAGSGKAVLIVGSGGVGLSFAAHARNLGATPVVMIGDRRRQSAGAAVGVTDFFRYDAPDVIPSISARYPGGFDLVLDAIGSERSADQALCLLRDGGVLNVYGLHDYWNQKLVLSGARGSFSVYRGGYDEAEAHEEVIQMVRAGALNAAHWLDLPRPFPLGDIGAAFDASRREEVIKALIALG